MAAPETWTLGRLLTWTTDYLRQHGADSPRLDAEVLLAFAVGCQRIQLYTRFDEVAKDDVRTKFRELVKERAEGKPVAYLVGKREFYSLPFRVTPDVLIPRPETEFLVIALADRIKQRLATPAAADPAKILDVGTGSGILAICAARESSIAKITAVDISGAALDVARQNAADLGVAERIEFLNSDLLESIPASREWDFVLSNPPYLAEHELAETARDVRDFEPRHALVAGPHGDEIYARLIPQAAERLKPGGWLLMEISPQLDTRVRELLALDNRWDVVEVTKDLGQRARVVQARRKG